MTQETKVTQADRVQMKEDCGLRHTPTEFTYHYRNAANGCGGPHEMDWEDKPRRLVLDLCNELERLASQQSVPNSVVEALEMALCAPDWARSLQHVHDAQTALTTLQQSGQTEAELLREVRGAIATLAGFRADSIVTNVDDGATAADVLARIDTHLNAT